MNASLPCVYESILWGGNEILLSPVLWRFPRSFHKAKGDIVASVVWVSPPVRRLCFVACLLFSIYQILCLYYAATLQEPSVYEEMESW